MSALQSFADPVERLVIIAKRWSEERKRLGYSQADFARWLNISRETERKYECGLSIPNAERLALAMEYGMDVLYVLGNQRTERNAA